MKTSQTKRQGDISLLTGATTIFSRLIHDLHRAHRSIDMEFYIFEGDKLGSVIIDILCRKARAGVVVRLLLDGFGSRRLRSSQRHALRMSGVLLHIYNKVSHRRIHRKLVVVDGRIAYVGGANIADRYVAGNGLGVWYDAMLRVEGRACKPIADILDADIRSGMQATSAVSSSVCDMRIYTSTSCGERDNIVAAFEEAFDMAHRKLLICTPYFAPPPHVMSLFEDAVGRGVHVELYVPARCGIPIADGVMRRRALEAASCGVEVRLCHDIFPHAKLLVVDNRYTLVGSANLDCRSLRYNSEIMVGIYRHSVVHAAHALFQLLERSAVGASNCRGLLYMPQSLSRLLVHLL